MSEQVELSNDAKGQLYLDQRAKVRAESAVRYELLKAIAAKLPPKPEPE